MGVDPLLILAGGFGTRLRAAVSEVPKPLAPVAGRPFLHYQIENWIAQGVTDFTFLLYHQAPDIQAFVARSRSGAATGKGGTEMRTLVEPEPLGTGGAVAYAVRELGLRGTFLVANADTWLGAGVSELCAAPAPAIGVVLVENSGRYGAVRVSATGKVTSFEEKRDKAGAGWINAGLYHLHADQFEGWDGRPFSIEQRLFPSLVDSGALKALPLHAEFIDIGVPAEYFRFCRWIESLKVAPL